MAIIIPKLDIDHDFNNSIGERRIYEALQQLPDEYVVFYSVAWQRKCNGFVRWGESDFTVFHPKRGLIVFEVKSGGIRRDDFGWFQTNLNTNEEKRLKRDPLDQAARSKYTFIDLIKDRLDLNIRIPVEIAVWFPSLDNIHTLSLPPNYSKEVFLSEKDLQTPLVSIENIYDYYNMNIAINIPGLEKDIIEILSPSFNAIPSLHTIITEQEYIFNRLTDEQSYLLDYLEEQKFAAIQGGAGTGKTVLAVEKAKRLASTEKVLLLCFNKLLLDSLKENLIGIQNIEVYNLQSLVCKLTGAVECFDNNKISDILNSINPGLWNYKHIIIDEGQDFFEKHLEILSKLAESKYGCFYVFYDKNQMIQQRQNLSWLSNLECRLVLNTNCRNTRYIATTSVKPLNIEKMKIKCDLAGNKPSIYFANNNDEAFTCLETIIANYISQGLNCNDIVILSTKTENSSVLACFNSIGVFKLKKNLKEDGVLFTTARKFKGLESKIVILIDVDDFTFCDVENRKVFYVGASRAKSFLDIVCTVDDKQIQNMSLALEGKASKYPKPSIATNLQVICKK